MALDYLLNSYLKNKRSKQKQAQLADEQTLIKYWDRVRPQSLIYDHGERQFHVGSRSMLFFLVLLLRNTSDTQHSVGDRIRYIDSIIRKFEKDHELRLIRLVGSDFPYFEKLCQNYIKPGKKLSQGEILEIYQIADAIRYFTMDDLVDLTALFPDEILPPYRKNRSYINSIMAQNEISKKDTTYCKEAFVRVGRGMYILNPDLVF